MANCQCLQNKSSYVRIYQLIALRFQNLKYLFQLKVHIYYYSIEIQNNKQKNMEEENCLFNFQSQKQKIHDKDSQSIVQKTKKIKKKLLKHKKAHIVNPQYLSIKYVYRLGDAIMLSQQSMRNPQTSSISYFGAIFNFKRIESIKIQNDFVTLNLKRIAQNFLPTQYAIERFKSFNDKELNEIAQNIRLMNQQLIHMSEQKALIRSQIQNGNDAMRELNVLRRKQQQDLNKLISTIKQDSKKFSIGIYYKETEQGLSLNKIFISTKLLEALGIDLKNLIQNYTKYKTLSLEIFSSEYYKFIFSTIINKSAKMFQKVRNHEEFVSQDFHVQSKGGYLFKKNRINGIQMEEKVKSDITFSKISRNISYFNIQNIEQNGFILKSKNQQNQTFHKIKYDQPNNIRKQIELLSKLNFNQQITIENDSQSSSFKSE